MTARYFVFVLVQHKGVKKVFQDVNLQSCTAMRLARIKLIQKGDTPLMQQTWRFHATPDS
jgi:hypothetical protein